MLVFLLRISLLFLYLTYVLSPVIQFGLFKLDQAKIASELCENRFQPRLHCDGQCVFAKKLKETEARKAPVGATTFKTTKAADGHFYQLFNIEVNLGFNLIFKNHFIPSSTGRPQGYCEEDFEPPQSIS